MMGRRYKWPNYYKEILYKIVVYCKSVYGEGWDKVTSKKIQMKNKKTIWTYSTFTTEGWIADELILASFWNLLSKPAVTSQLRWRSAEVHLDNIRDTL